jgi:hypothetical protein
MSHRDIKKLLKEVKDAPEFGGEFSDVEVTDSWQNVADEIGLDKEATPRSYGISEYVDYVVHTFGTTVVRPVAVTMASVVLVFSGWVTTVDASKNSVPGDMLYPVKLAAERIQLTISPREERTRLRVAFAGRRLQEASALSQSDRPDKDEQVEQAVAKFKEEMTSASGELEKLQESDPEKAAQVAVEVGEKTQEYEQMIEESAEDASEQTKDDVASAKETVEESAKQATETLVKNFEETTSRETGDQLHGKFQSDLKDVRSRITLNLGRLDVIESKLEEDNTYADRIEAARDNLYGHDETLTDAMDMVARNGYRRAFEMLGGVEESVEASESTITELEIEISTTDVDTTDGGDDETSEENTDNNNEGTGSETDGSDEDANTDNNNETDADGGNEEGVDAEANAENADEDQEQTASEEDASTDTTNDGTSETDTSEGP